MPQITKILAVAAACIGVVFVVAGIIALTRRRILNMVFGITFGLLLLVSGLLFGTIGVATQGYRMLTKEDLAAVVTTEPIGAQQFMAHFRFPDGHELSYLLAGDELYVDARILKWKPIVNFFGLHTIYELDRVSGRYLVLKDEQSRNRTVFSLATEKPWDLFQLRRRYQWLRPLVDAEYGSATFITADKPAKFEVRVSTTGLLIRRLSK
ncbi:MAG: hypothetical protein V2B13_02395 [Pseudomonadota bacterium]